MSQVHVAHVNRCHAALQLFSKGPILPPVALHASACHLVYCSFLTSGLWRALCTRTVAAILIASPACSRLTACFFLSLFPLSLTLTRSLPHAHARSMPGHRRIEYVPAHSYSHLTIHAPRCHIPLLPSHSRSYCTAHTLPPFLSPSHIAFPPSALLLVPYLRFYKPSGPFIPGKSSSFSPQGALVSLLRWPAQSICAPRPHPSDLTSDKRMSQCRLDRQRTLVLLSFLPTILPPPLACPPTSIWYLEFESDRKPTHQRGTVR